MTQTHYFSAEPADEADFRPLTVELDGEPRRLVTVPGIFSPGGLDKGTRILLDEVPEPAGRTMLDIGCGWGPIALTMALRAEDPAARVWAVDVNPRALEATRRNAQALGLPVTAAAGVPDGVTFDTIWSNPPIRIGKAALHELLLAWIPRLNSGGTAWMVVQKNLGADSLQAWLAGELGAGYDVSRYAGKKAFRVLRVERLGDPRG